MTATSTAGHGTPGRQGKGSRCSARLRRSCPRRAVRSSPRAGRRGRRPCGCRQPMPPGDIHESHLQCGHGAGRGSGLGHVTAPARDRGRGDDQPHPGESVDGQRASKQSQPRPVRPSGQRSCIASVSSRTRNVASRTTSITGEPAGRSLMRGFGTPQACQLPILRGAPPAWHPGIVAAD